MRGGKQTETDAEGSRQQLGPAEPLLRPLEEPKNEIFFISFFSTDAKSEDRERNILVGFSSRFESLILFFFQLPSLLCPLPQLELHLLPQGG